MENSVIIIGAGAAGLMAARKLSRAGRQVTVLEARERIGGRIHSWHNESFFREAELGAEFIHGNLPLTLDLLKEAGLSTQKISMQMWRHHDGKFVQEEQQAAHWDKVMDRLNDLTTDMPIALFMDKYFGGDEYAEVRRSVLQFVSGYDTADPQRASSFALRNEWQHEDDGAQHRINNGYSELMQYLADDIKNQGGKIELNAVVKQINLYKAGVQVITSNDVGYYAGRVIIALPLGVLQHGDVKFNLLPDSYTQALQQIGFGYIIKILIRFTVPFWEDKRYGGIKDTAFLFSYEKIPTWWTQGPHKALLTGWLGGLPALALKDMADDEVWHLALQSLSNLIKLSIDELNDKLIAWHVGNWTADAFTRGSYAYDMVASPAARSILVQPVADSLFFAGEYLYDGPAMGTVEAALHSANAVADRLLEGSDQALPRK